MVLIYIVTTWNVVFDQARVAIWMGDIQKDKWWLDEELHKPPGPSMSSIAVWVGQAEDNKIKMGW